MLIAPEQGGMRVTAASEAAGAAGVHPGMLLADARALAPDLRAFDAEPEKDAAALRELARWTGRYSPWVAPDGMDGLLIDASGCAHLFGGEAAMLADMERRLQDFGIAARAAIADTPGAAWALARYGPAGKTGTLASVVTTGGQRAAMAGLPLGALRLEEAVVDGLDKLGFKTVGDLYDVPRAPIAARFGDVVGRRLDEALGTAFEPISPDLPETPFRTRMAFGEPIARTGDIEAAIGELAEMLCRTLDKAGQGARRLTLTLFRVDGAVTALSVGTSAPAREPEHLARLFKERLETLGGDFDAGFGFETMTLAADVAERCSPDQHEIAPDRQGAGDRESEAKLGFLVDRIGNRLGMRNVVRLRPGDSHLPERAVVAVSAGAGPAPMTPARPPLGDDWRDEVTRADGALDRPLRVLGAPEPIEAIAEIPDGPPVRFRWRRVLYRVARAEGPERIAPEWWQAECLAEGTKRVLTRDYFRVEDDEGRRFWLYRDGLYGRETDAPRWYVHGVFA